MGVLAHGEQLIDQPAVVIQVKPFGVVESPVDTLYWSNSRRSRASWAVKPQRQASVG